MRTPLKVLILCTVFSLTLSCDSSDDKPDPYLYIHIDPLQFGQDEIWVFVTNTHGEIVDYTSFGAEGGERQLTTQKTPIDGIMNVYAMTVTRDNDNSSYWVDATLGVKPGQHYHYSYGREEETHKQKTLQAVLFDLPDHAVVHGPYEVTLTDADSEDGTIDETKIEWQATEGMPSYPVTVYTRETPLYASLSYNATDVQEFSYPDDFQNFDHTLEIFTDEYPSGIASFGVTKGVSYSFSFLGNPDDIQLADADQSFKLCYLNGYEDYQTYFTIHNSEESSRQSYFKNGDIPTSDNVIIPHREISISSSDLDNFKFTADSKIVYRRSYYIWTATQDGIFHYRAIEVKGPISNELQFDLELPAEFIEAHGDLNFSQYEYSGTDFYEYESGQTYNQVVDINFNVPESYDGVEFYMYEID